MPVKPHQLHPRNKHQGQYDFEALIKACPNLKTWVHLNEFGKQSIDFFNAEAVKALNQALLKHFYQIDWDLPQGYLCPPIPGRADYIHHAADLLSKQNKNSIPKGAKIRCLDVGVGANCIYPILGHLEYGWSFVGTDIEPKSIQHAQSILDKNQALLGQSIALRHQSNSKHILKNIIASDELFDLTICNPPFHASAQAAESAALRKLGQLKGKKAHKADLNFGGQYHELWCQGGEKAFIEQLLIESQAFAHTCCWFTSLVSKEAHLKAIYQAAKKANVTTIKTISMGQGQKKSRFVAWTFLDPKPLKYWTLARF